MKIHEKKYVSKKKEIIKIGKNETWNENKSN